MTRVEGHASLWWRRDLSDDVVAKGAFAESLARTGAGGVRMLHQHDGAEPVGVWDEIGEDERGLFVRGRIVEETPRGRLVGALVKAGALDGLRLSWAVTRGSTWRVFLTLAVIALALVVLASLVQESVALVVGAAGGAAVAGGVIVTAVGALMSVVLGVMLPIATTIVYLDLRARRAATAGGQPATAGVRD